MTCGKGLTLIALCSVHAGASAMERCDYSRESANSCSSEYTRISTAADCDEAALSLDLPAKASLTLSNKNILPLGCYFMISTSQLYFNPVGSDSTNDTDRISICANKACQSKVSSARLLQDSSNSSNSSNMTAPPTPATPATPAPTRNIPACSAKNGKASRNKWCRKKCHKKGWKKGTCSGSSCRQKCLGGCDCVKKCADDETFYFMEKDGQWSIKRGCAWVGTNPKKYCKAKGFSVKADGSEKKAKAKKACPTMCGKCKARRLGAIEFV